MRGKSLMLLVAGLAAASVLDAGCGLKRRYRCTATGIYEKKMRQGHGSDFTSESAAKSTAVSDICRTYCMMEDPKVEAAYQKAKGAKVADYVARLQIVNNEPVLSVLRACIAPCDRAMATASIGQSCTYWGI